MKAIVYKHYGNTDVMELKEIPRPEPKDDEVLIKVYCISLNSADWEMMRGKPRFYRIFFGLIKPKYPIIGSDIAGVVEATGKDVKNLKPGDEVMGDLSGDGWGGFAEYVIAHEKSLVKKPKEISFEQAACLPQAAEIAFQSIIEKNGVKKGQKVLINGAGGGFGLFAIQFAKMAGAEVTAVDNPLKLNAMMAMGADKVIDYTKENFTKNIEKYDVIVDPVAYRCIFDYKRVLNRKGIYTMIGGSVRLLLMILLIGPIISLFSSKKINFLAYKPNKNLAHLGELVEIKKLITLIDKRFTLEEVPQALQYIGEGKSVGKTIINVNHGQI